MRREPGGPDGNGGDDREGDDWLAGDDELDWLSDPRRRGPARGREEFEPSAGPARAPAPTWGGPARRPSAPSADTIARRRIVAALTAGGIVILIVVAVVLATSGGGSPRTSAAPTTPLPTEPATQPAQPTVRSTTTTTAASAPASTSSAPQRTTPVVTQEVTLPASGALKRGDSGAEVVALQQALATLGLDVGQADGSFGPTTEAAVIAFQNANGLAPDGVVGATTANKLNEALASRG